MRFRKNDPSQEDRPADAGAVTVADGRTDRAGVTPEPVGAPVTGPPSAPMAAPVAGPASAPVGRDLDGDGRADTVVEPGGRVHDGRPDTMAERRELDGDGRAGTAVDRDADTVVERRDVDGDGRPDTTVERRDLDGDGHPDTVADRDGDGRPDTLADDATLLAPGVVRRDVVAREKERYGGVKIGAAFFGWLTATGMAVILVALLAAAGTTVGLADTPIEDAAAGVAEPETIGLAGVIGLLIILFVSYYCGGYVAGRMARFNGIRQGLAVWAWAIVMAVVVAILAAVAGDEFDVLAGLNVFPRLPFNEGDVTTGGVVAVVIVLATSLVGATLGGLGGMHFHRAVDKAGLGR